MSVTTGVFPSARALSHIDPENPTDALALTFAGPLHPECQEIYQRLLVAFLEQALGTPEDRAFDRALAAYAAAGSVRSPP